MAIRLNVAPIFKPDAPVVQLDRIDMSPTLQVAIKIFDNMTLPNLAEMLPNRPGIPPIVRQPGFWVYIFLFISCEYSVSLMVNAGQPWWLEKLLMSLAWGGVLAYLPALLANIIRRVWATQISALMLPAAVSSSNSVVGQLCVSCADIAPDGWLDCNGQAVCRSKFSGLFAAIGDKFGEGDKATTFNVPDLQGRVAVGRGTQDSQQFALGQTGGAIMHALQLHEMPAHTHAIHDYGHAHHILAKARKFVPNGGGGLGIDQLKGTGEGTEQVSGPTNTAHSNIELENTGNGHAHNNMQPYIVMSYFIKY